MVWMIVLSISLGCWVILDEVLLYQKNQRLARYDKLAEETMEALAQAQIILSVMSAEISTLKACLADLRLAGEINSRG